MSARVFQSSRAEAAKSRMVDLRGVGRASVTPRGAKPMCVPLIYFLSSRAKLNWNGFKDPTREIEREKEKEDAVPYTNKSIRDARPWRPELQASPTH